MHLRGNEMQALFEFDDLSFRIHDIEGYTVHYEGRGRPYEISFSFYPETDEFFYSMLDRSPDPTRSSFTLKIIENPNGIIEVFRDVHIIELAKPTIEDERIATFSVKMLSYHMEYQPYDPDSLKVKKIEPKEFKINEYITLKLEKNKTEIYVGGKPFRQCKYLLLNLESGDSYDEITSIDEAAKKLNRGMEHDHSIITPEEEFQGHCSNLQAWVENEYDLRIIHTNLGFPLLEELAKYDKKARYVLKEEMMFRMSEGGFNSITTLKNKVMKYFNKEEKEALIEMIKGNEEFIDRLIKNYLSNEYQPQSNWRWSDEYLQEPAHIPPTRPIPRTMTYQPSEEIIEIRGGAGQDDDMQAAGDFLDTIARIFRNCDELGMLDIRMRIISDSDTWEQAQVGNHVNTDTGMVELERIMALQDVSGNRIVSEWLISRDLEYQMIFQVYYTTPQDPMNVRMREFKTGRLWLV